MAKALCIVGMIISILVFIVFLSDLVLPVTLAPFMKASRVMDIAFVLCALGLGYLSWSTWREQV
jgi:hypothetical protein